MNFFFSLSFDLFQMAGGMITSADDMTLWMHVLLHRGLTPEGNRILSERSLKEMQTAHVLVSLDMGMFLYEPQFPVTYTDSGYGFAWFAAQYRGYRIVKHPGVFPGYNSFLGLLPDLDLGIFIAANTSGHMDALQALFYFITDLILGLKPWLTAEDAYHFPEPWIKPWLTAEDAYHFPEPWIKPWLTAEDAYHFPEPWIKPWLAYCRRCLPFSRTLD
ncbi:hypothetical protein ACOMHN_056685 [Nucella lapillus]